jgi:tetratricopeptide (TPR) repeat protein
MIGEHPFLGTGPGQFVVEFPPYRQLEEIEASTNRADGRFYTEVEHPHQDGLLVLSEYGLLAGGALLTFWLLAGVAALRALRSGSSRSGATVACALVASLVGSLVNAPLGMNPVAAVPAFVAMGMVLAARVANPGRASLALPGALLLLLLFSVPRALSAVRLGLALADLGSETANVVQHAGPVQRAAEACPDSVVARGLMAQWYEKLDEDTSRALGEWEAVLALRPHRVEALLESARLHARRNEFGAALPRVRHVLELDPEHPIALRNRARFEFYAGRIEAGREALDAVERNGLFTQDFGLSLAAGLLLSGQAREGLVVLERVSPDWAGLDGDRAWVEAGKRRNASDERLADALESHAHRLWARDLAEAGNPSRAIAVYRQNLLITRDYVPGGAPRVRMELCAAQWLAGRTESAAETARGLEPLATDWASLPAWAGEALRESGLFE